MFRAAVEEADDALSYKLARFRQSIAGAAGLSARQKRVEAFLEELSRLGLASMSGVRKRLVLARLSDLLDLPMNELEQLVPKSRTAHRPTGGDASGAASRASDETPTGSMEESASGAMASRARRLAEEWALSVLLYEPQTAADRPDDLEGGSFHTEPNRTIAGVLFSRVEGGLSFTMQDVLSGLASETARAAASRLYFEGEKAVESRHGGDAAAALGEALESLRACEAREAYLARVKQHQQPTNGEGAQAEGDDGLQALIELLEARNQQGHVPAFIKQGVRP
jgi:hypothetical protein